MLASVAITSAFQAGILGRVKERCRGQFQPCLDIQEEIEMHTHTDLVRKKRKDPEFWDMLDAERDALCKILAEEGDCPELVKRLENCSTRWCGLAACPACLARADRHMYRSIQKMCEGDGETIFLRISGAFGLPKPADDLVPGYLKGIGDVFEFNKVSVDSYIGRYYFEPAVLEEKDGETFNYDTGFVGAMRLTDFDIESTDDLIKAAEFADGEVAQIHHGMNLHYFFDPYYFSDPWCLPWSKQGRHRLGMTKDNRDTSDKVRLAKWLGLKPASFLYLYRVRKN